MSDRVLVTGGAGFIGSHVCENLADRGHQVWLLDSFNGQYSPTLKRRNVTGLAGRPSVHLVEGDVRDTVLLAGLLADVDFDAVAHLAARPGLLASTDDPDAGYDVGVRGTRRLLEAMRRHSVRRIVLASSTSVYGARDGAPFSEDDAADRPMSADGAANRAAELVAHTYHAAHDLSVHCLRLSAVYGSRQPPNQAVHRWARLLDAGEPVPADGASVPTRSYVHVSDAVDAIRLSLDGLGRQEEPVYEILNIGGPRCVPHSAFLSRLSSALGADADIGSEDHGEAPADADGARTTCVSGEKARATLGYEPRIELADGLREFARWFRTEGDAVRGNGGEPGSGQKSADRTEIEPDRAHPRGSG